MRANDLDHAIELVNATPYGLTSGLFSLDEHEQRAWSERVQAGNLYVNRGVTGAIVRRQPFGGWKASSFGPGAKAGGPSYVLELSRTSDGSAPRALDPPHPNAAVLLGYLKRYVDPGDHRRLAAAACAYQHQMRTYFNVQHDPSGVLGEMNVLRYWPASPLLVRAASDAVLGEALLACIAGSSADAKLTLSVDPSLVEKVAWLSGLPLITFVSERATECAERIARVLRVRAIGSVESEVARAAETAQVHVEHAPVSFAGRVELGRYLREQSLSVSYHRSGYCEGRRLLPWAPEDAESQWSQQELSLAIEQPACDPGRRDASRELVDAPQHTEIVVGHEREAARGRIEQDELRVARERSGSDQRKRLLQARVALQALAIALRERGEVDRSVTLHAAPAVGGNIDAHAVLQQPRVARRAVRIDLGEPDIQHTRTRADRDGLRAPQALLAQQLAALEIDQVAPLDLYALQAGHVLARQLEPGAVGQRLGWSVATVEQRSYACAGVAGCIRIVRTGVVDPVTRGVEQACARALVARFERVPQPAYEATQAERRRVGQQARDALQWILHGHAARSAEACAHDRGDHFVEHLGERVAVERSWVARTRRRSARRR
jgi:hypothetical protein